MTCINKRKLGSLKEDEAVTYLENNNYTIVERNFWSHFGEVDIISKENGYLVFLEVKFRSSNKYGYPQEAVIPSKQRAIINTALFYMHKKGIPPECPIRFDILVISGDKFTLLKNAFGTDSIC